MRGPGTQSDAALLSSFPLRPNTHGVSFHSPFRVGIQPALLGRVPLLRVHLLLLLSACVCLPQGSGLIILIMGFSSAACQLCFECGGLAEREQAQISLTTPSSPHTSSTPSLLSSHPPLPSLCLAIFPLAWPVCACVCFRGVLASLPVLSCCADALPCSPCTSEHASAPSCIFVCPSDQEERCTQHTNEDRLSSTPPTADLDSFSTLTCTCMHSQTTNAPLHE